MSANIVKETNFILQIKLGKSIKSKLDAKEKNYRLNEADGNLEKLLPGIPTQGKSILKSKK